MSKVVFVGNVPYNMGEDQLIDIFKSVGHVVAFRLLFDRENGKPRGFGFAEYADHETALSAVRNLNGVEAGGRPLRIDLADSDPSLEGKTTYRGELVDAELSRASSSSLSSNGSFSSFSSANSSFSSSTSNGSSPDEHELTTFLSSVVLGVELPPGVSSVDAITQLLGSMTHGQLVEILAQMKAFIISHTDLARALLTVNPQLTYALLQAGLTCGVIPQTVLGKVIPPPPIPEGQMPHQGFPSVQMQINPYSTSPPSSQISPSSSLSLIPSPSPPSSFYQAPPAVPSTPVIPPDISEQQHAMLMQVLNMTPEQVNAVPEQERAAINQLRAKFIVGS